VQACREALGDALTQELAGLPFDHVDRDTYVCHASPVSDVRSFMPEPADDEAELLEGVTARRLIFGHTHLPFRRERDGDRAREPGLGRHAVRRRHARCVCARARRRSDRAPPRRLRPRGQRGPRARPLRGGWADVVARRIEQAAMVD
jgi:hypothetical protein